MVYKLRDKDGFHALDPNQIWDWLNFGVVSGCSVSPGTDDLTVQVTAGEIVFNGEFVDVAAQDNVALSAADSTNPRKDTVYIDSAGTLQVATGTAESATPSGETRRDTYRPAPPDLSTTDATVLAEVWIPTGATDIATGDVSDRRLFVNPTFGSVTTPNINTTIYAREEVTGGSGTEADPFVVPTTITDGYWGELKFNRGWYQVDGLASDPDVDYNSRALYIDGDGVRSTTLRHSSSTPSTPTIKFQNTDSGDNFGGVTNMTVYGGGRNADGDGTANLIESTGDIIDLQFRNLILRYAGNNAMQMDLSSSGTRIENCWIENYGNLGIKMVDGSRCKVSDVHMLGGKAMDWNGTRGTITNLTHYQTDETVNAIDVTSSRNKFNNIEVWNQFYVGLYVYGGENLFSNVILDGAWGSAIQVGASNNTFKNIIVKDWGKDFGRGIRVLADSVFVQGLYAIGADTANSYSTQVLELDGNYNYVNGVGGVRDGTAWELDITSGTENVIDNAFNFDWANITDAGTRTLINRYGTNEGDPTTTGQWNGHADYAGIMGATIWDTSTTPWTKYEATPNGSWV